ncbi:MAG: hypothetical protein JOZ32_17535 [Bryobacterales bacterium]|nr:hypothetical protein [Bryobacterales bacterium]
MASFFTGLFLLSAGTLIYEIVLTRLLSVVAWYYLAFVSVSMAMFGMTAGALLVQLVPAYFAKTVAPQRINQAVFAAALSMPLSLITMLAVPVELSRAVESLYSFLLLSVVIAVPFFFAGIAVCLSLTRAPFSVGRIYFADLAGAAAGCFASVGLLSILDGPSAVFATSAIMFLSAALYSFHAGNRAGARKANFWVLGMLVLTALNAATPYGIQPIWSKGYIDRRSNFLLEIWNPISKIRASDIETKAPQMWGPSPVTPKTEVQEISLDIDNDAETPITRFDGDLDKVNFLRYDVTSIAAQLRRGGTAAIIGLGGGRDALNCALNGFHRIVALEVNKAILNLTTRRFASFSGIKQIPGLEYHNDEGRSYLTRSGERFDLIQASMVDTWAATSAGAMTLSENALYTVDGWRIFYEHLKPGGIITFSRWYGYSEVGQTYRLFAVAWATLLEEGVQDPARYLAVIRSGQIATLLVSNRPFTSSDLATIKSVSSRMQFEPLYLPGEPVQVKELAAITKCRSAADLDRLRSDGYIDYSPVYDSAPYFFNAVHLINVPRLIEHGGVGQNLRAILFVAAFMFAAVILVAVTIILPAAWWGKRQGSRPLAGGVIYFIAIGLGFMLVEMAMIQQLTIFLGHPIYALIVVLAGLILSSGVGSLASDALRLRSRLQSNMPAIAVVAVIGAYLLVVVPLIHRFTAQVLSHRVLISLLLIAPPGFLMGYCFPIGMRWLRILGQEKNLPWMWALNGAAGTLGSFVAIAVSMDTSIATCALTGAACYLVAGISMPGMTASRTS